VTSALLTQIHTHTHLFTFYLLPFWYRLTRVVLEKGPLNGFIVVVVFLIARCSFAVDGVVITDSYLLEFR